MQQAAEALHITAEKLKKLGLIDSICEEPVGGAHGNRTLMYDHVSEHLSTWLNASRKQSVKERLALRYKKFRAMGKYSEVG